MNSELPVGINDEEPTRWWEEDEVIPVDYCDLWSCSNCELSLEALLLQMGTLRYEGLIRKVGSQSSLWSNKLPRDRDKALKLLQENFSHKVENHKKVH